MTPNRLLAHRGLSPRGRGKPWAAAAAYSRRRSIPAWAGETLAANADSARIAVYPRVGGGNVVKAPTDAGKSGLSPRGRGKLARVRAIVSGQGSIPAWAGETAMRNACRPYLRVYPRVGGGNQAKSRHSARARGLSPRGRGKRQRQRRQLTHRRSIPAWAGETPIPPPSQGAGGSIPAWAGETMAGSMSTKISAVYPRVGGGNAGTMRWRYGRIGLSPRGRGKRRLSIILYAGSRSIPAWAGETLHLPAQACSRTVYPRVGGGN